MAKSRGRPKGSGTPEDEPVLREAMRALISGEVRSPLAAADKFADSVPGTSHESKRRRLYGKLLKRRAELEKEILAESDDYVGIDDEEWHTLFMVGQEILGEKSLDDKLARLSGFLRVEAEIESLRSDLVEMLGAEGLELSSTLESKLTVILNAYRSFSHPVRWFRDKHRVSKFRQRKKLASKSGGGLAVNPDGKKDESTD